MKFSLEALIRIVARTIKIEEIMKVNVDARV